MAFNNHSGMAGSSSRTAPLSTFSTPLRVILSLGVIASMLLVVFNVVSAQETTPAPAGTPEATPSAAMPRIELQLEEVNESDLGGTVVLYEYGNKTIVEFEVEGAGGDHPAYIAGGTCESPTEPPLFELNEIDERGRSTTVIDTSLEDLLDEDHIVSIRMTADDVDTTIACATIEGEPGLDAGATPEASPMATPGATPSATPDADGVGGSSAQTPEAVGDGTEGPATTTPAATTPDTSGDGTGGTTATTTTSTEGDTLTIKLTDWSDTGVSGTALLTDMGNSTQIEVTLTGDAIVGGHELHLHNGTCTTPGTATYTLNPIDANGTSTSTVNLSLDTLAKNSYFLNVHPDEANWDNWMVCGNITGTATPPSAQATQPPVVVSGDGTGGGNVTMTTTNAQAAAFPQTVGVGDGLRWPSDTRTAVIWGLGASIVVMTTAAITLRMGERSGRTARYSRLGL